MHMLGASIRDSRAYSESEGMSLGSSISRNPPGHIVVEVAGHAARVRDVWHDGLPICLLIHTYNVVSSPKMT